MTSLLKAALQASHIKVYGTYTHANFSYTATDGQTAAKYLGQEIAAANACAKHLLNLVKEFQTNAADKLHEGRLRLAVGATPTANAAAAEWAEARAQAGVGNGDLVGEVEL